MHYKNMLDSNCEQSDRESMALIHNGCIHLVGINQALPPSQVTSICLFKSDTCVVFLIIQDSCKITSDGYDCKINSSLPQRSHGEGVGISE
jgi:hypothetical protein